MFTQRLNTLGVAYMVSGSVAVIIYGEPRLTHDVDLIVVLDRAYIARLPLAYRAAVRCLGGVGAASEILKIEGYSS
jgi:hypothetical protein